MTDETKHSVPSGDVSTQKPADSDVESRFNDLLNRYGNILRGAIARICPKHLGVQFSDIEQEARIRLWKAISSEREIANPGSYIYKIAVSVTINAINQVKARREDQLDAGRDDGEVPERVEPMADPGQSPEAQAARNELIDKVGRVMARLPENRRLAVGLYLKGMTTEEIAGLMGWNEPKARNLAYRGLKDLRQLLRAEGIEWE